MLFEQIFISFLLLKNNFTEYEILSGVFSFQHFTYFTPLFAVVSLSSSGLCHVFLFGFLSFEYNMLRCSFFLLISFSFLLFSTLVWCLLFIFECPHSLLLHIFLILCSFFLLLLTFHDMNVVSFEIVPLFLNVLIFFLYSFWISVWEISIELLSSSVIIFSAMSSLLLSPSKTF